MTRVSRRSTVVAILAAVLVVAVIFGASIWLRSSISRNFVEQHAVRAAQLNRSHLFRLQLDEETGMRGYIATRAPQFLDPYHAAVAAFPATVRDLQAALRDAGLSDTLLARERALNGEWLRTVAEPAIRRRRIVVAQQIRGKQLVDRFRASDAQLYGALNRRAAETDASSAKILDAILFAVFPAGLLIGAALILAAIRQRYLEDRVRFARAAYEEEKRIADALQQAFVQSELPETAAARLHAMYVPAGLQAKVGGDWYDAFQLPDQRILFSLGDVAGHGVGSAVTMSRVRQAILSIGMHEYDPAVILARANRLLMMQDAAMVTAVCGFIDVASGTIHYAMAGHPPLRLALPDGTVQSLPHSGPPLGAVDDAVFSAHSASAQPDALLVAYTDGLVEESRDWIRGEALLTDAIAAVYREKAADPAAAIVARVFEGRAPSDDVAILTISFRRAQPEGAPVIQGASAAARQPLSDAVDAALRCMTPIADARAV